MEIEYLTRKKAVEGWTRYGVMSEEDPFWGFVYQKWLKWYESDK